MLRAILFSKSFLCNRNYVIYRTENFSHKEIWMFRISEHSKYFVTNIYINNIFEGLTASILSATVKKGELLRDGIHQVDGIMQKYN